MGFSRLLEKNDPSYPKHSPGLVQILGISDFRAY